MSKVLPKLKGGDLRSIGRVDEVIEDVLKDPKLFADLFEGMLDDNPIIRMRSADAVEKISAQYPEYLQSYKDRLIDEISKIRQQEVRWHAAQMFSYLELNRMERDRIIQILLHFIDTDKSKIVKVNSMQTLANFAEKDEAIKPVIIKN